MPSWSHLAAAVVVSLSTGSLAATASPVGSIRASSPAPASMQAALDGFVARLEQAIGGRIGVSVRLIETGETATTHAGEGFPMASTYKIAIAGTLLSRIDRGDLRLDQLVPVTQIDVDRTGPVADHVIHPGVSLSVANLLELMLTQSNNTATDKLLALTGGPSKVNAWLRLNGVDGLRVDRSVNDLLNDFMGLAPGSAFRATYTKQASAPDAKERAAKEALANQAFEMDARDTSTPPAMTDLLAKLYAGGILKPASRDLLVAIMERCETGKGRIPALLPEGTVAAHKTGTIGGTINDVGVITLPQDRGHLAIALFTKNSALPMPQRERAIAEISRAMFDYFAMR